MRNTQAGSPVAPFVVMAKASGPVCNTDCGYCYYLSKTALFPRASGTG